MDALSAYEQVAEKAPELRGRVQSLYHEKLNQVDGNLRDRRLVEAHIAIGEERFRDAEALLKSFSSDGDLVPLRGLLGRLSSHPGESSHCTRRVIPRTSPAVRKRRRRYCSG